MPDVPMRLVDSVRSAEDVIYADGLGDDAVLTFTQDAPASDPTALAAGVRERTLRHEVAHHLGHNEPGVAARL